MLEALNMYTVFGWIVWKMIMLTLVLTGSVAILRFLFR